MSRAILGLDIGGANLKAAHTCKVGAVVPFQLWKQPDQLTTAIRRLLEPFPPSDVVAVTMTGELCDCFASKSAGVRHIVNAVCAALPGKPLHFWRNDGRFVRANEALEDPLPLAAANWLALATFAGQLALRSSSLLIDLGSTTTDIIPIDGGDPIPRGRTDTERLRSGELVYVGASRTPLCALLGPGHAAEWFATTRDVYLELGMTGEDPNDTETADGRPATRHAAQARLARMLCADADAGDDRLARRLAEQADARVRAMIKRAIHRVVARLPSVPSIVITAGSGEFLAQAIVRVTIHPRPRIISLNRKLGATLSSAACAYALAVLAQEALHDES